MDRTSILIVDSSAEVSKELESALIEYDPLHASRTAGTPEEAFEIGKAFRPDMIIYDLPLGGASDVETIGGLKSMLRDTRIIVISLYEDYRLAAMTAGASEFVLKTAPRSKLLEALQRQSDRAGPPHST